MLILFTPFSWSLFWRPSLVRTLLSPGGSQWPPLPLPLPLPPPPAPPNWTTPPPPSGVRALISVSALLFLIQFGSIILDPSPPLILLVISHFVCSIEFGLNCSYYYSIFITSIVNWCFQLLDCISIQCIVSAFRLLGLSIELRRLLPTQANFVVRSPLERSYRKAKFIYWFPFLCPWLGRFYICN